MKSAFTKDAWINGVLTGMLLQLALGPVFFYIVNLAIQRSTADGLAGMLGALTGDSLYIILSVLGVGSLLNKPAAKTAFSIISAAVLILIGVATLCTALRPAQAAAGAAGTPQPLVSYLSVLVMTLSNPLTIVFFSSIFSAKAFEHGYDRLQLVWFGLGTATATVLFLSLSVILVAWIRDVISSAIVAGLNGVVGLVLIGYGFKRLLEIRRERAERQVS